MSEMISPNPQTISPNPQTQITTSNPFSDFLSNFRTHPTSTPANTYLLTQSISRLAMPDSFSDFFPNFRPQPTSTPALPTTSTPAQPTSTPAKSKKGCSHHKCKWRKVLCWCCAGLLIFNFILLLIWAILQPKKPRFILQDATIFALNVSAANVISTTVQINIYSRNPNSKIGVYYDKLDAYATYHNQQVTYYTVIPPDYQGHKDVNVWSPFLCGNDVPVAPYNGLALAQDQTNGAIKLTVKLDGHVKWKVGSFVSGRYHIHVSCPAYIPLGNSKSNGIVVGTGVKYQLSQSCSVSV